MRVLTVNTGSSSLKAGWYEVESGTPRARGAEQARGVSGDAGFSAALGRALARFPAPQAVGHRLVMAGAAPPGSRELWAQARRLDADAIAELRDMIPSAPDHLPQAVAAIRLIDRIYPGVPQFGCSDSAFHRTLPPAARTLALPAWARARGLERHGFHGLSCEYAISVLAAEGPLPERVVIAHLGNGCSLTAVRDGRSLDTTMGFTPLGGMPMSTRSGDLDPGVVVELLRQSAMDAEKLSQMLNRESGLLGISGITSDMKTLLERCPGDSGAALAVEIFVYQARKFLGALAAVLGGIDLLVFTGGIGENSALIRARICQDLEWLSMQVRVIAADEDLMIARHTANAAGAASLPMTVERKET